MDDKYFVNQEVRIRPHADEGAGEIGIFKSSWVYNCEEDNIKGYDFRNEEVEIEEMDDEKCPALKVGEWIILTDKGLWGIDAYSFGTKEDAVAEAMGDVYLSKEIKQLTDDNVAYYQDMLQKQWDSDTEF